MTVCPGVIIGERVTVGAASVVTKDVPSRSVIIGNAGRVIKKIKTNDTLEPVSAEVV